MLTEVVVKRSIYWAFCVNFPLLLSPRILTKMKGDKQHMIINNTWSACAADLDGNTTDIVWGNSNLILQDATERADIKVGRINKSNESEIHVMLNGL